MCVCVWADVKQEAMRTLESDVARVEAELQSTDSLMLTEGYDWDGKQAELDGKIDDIATSRDGGTHILDFLKKALDRTHRPDANCMLCATKLTDSAKECIKTKHDQMKTKVDTGRSGGRNLEAELSEAREHSRKHKRAQEQWTVAKRQKQSELPATQQTLDKLKQEQQALKREHDKLVAEGEQLSDRAEKAKDLMRDVDHLKYAACQLAISRVGMPRMCWY